MYDYNQYTVVDIRIKKLQFDLGHIDQFYFNA